MPFLRQQIAKREGRANMCLADFIVEDGEDWIGGFAVGIHGIEPHLVAYKAAHDDYNDILLKALAALRNKVYRKCRTLANSYIKNIEHGRVNHCSSSGRHHTGPAEGVSLLFENKVRWGECLMLGLWSSG